MQPVKANDGNTERPVLMRCEEVRSILEGRARVFMRPLKPQPPESAVNVKVTPGSDCVAWINPSGMCVSPYGRAGARLWVRETWRVSSVSCNYVRDTTMLFVSYRAGHKNGFKQYQNNFAGVDQDFISKAYGRYKFGTWRPSVHMPRWASRLLLEIINIRIERLQYIGLEGAIATGVDAWDDYVGGKGISAAQARGRFRALWDAAYAKKRLDWETNPWVWVIEFRVISQSRAAQINDANEEGTLRAASGKGGERPAGKGGARPHPPLSRSPDPAVLPGAVPWTCSTREEPGKRLQKAGGCPNGAWGGKAVRLKDP